MPVLSDPIIDLLASGIAGLGVWSILVVLPVATQRTLFAVILYLHRRQAHRIAVPNADTLKALLSHCFQALVCARRSSGLILCGVLIVCSACVPAFVAQAQVQDSQAYLQRMDTDGDGRVSGDEYLAWMRYAFDQRDLDHDGVLQGDELPGRRGKPVTRAAHRATLIERFALQDANGDGYLSARELLAPPR